MPWRTTAVGSFSRSLELVCWRQPMASCKALGPSGSSKPFGRLLRCAAGELGRVFMSTRANPDEGDFTEGHELDRKWKVAKGMVGRRLSQEEAKKLLMNLE